MIQVGEIKEVETVTEVTEHSEMLVIPARKAHKPSSLEKRARAAMRDYGITLGLFDGRRIIYNDHNAPAKALNLVRKALSKGCIA